MIPLYAYVVSVFLALIVGGFISFLAMDVREQIHDAKDRGEGW